MRSEFTATVALTLLIGVVTLGLQEIDLSIARDSVHIRWTTRPLPWAPGPNALAEGGGPTCPRNEAVYSTGFSILVRGPSAQLRCAAKNRRGTVSADVFRYLGVQAR